MKQKEVLIFNIGAVHEWPISDQYFVHVIGWPDVCIGIRYFLIYCT